MAVLREEAAFFAVGADFLAVFLTAFLTTFLAAFLAAFLAVFFVAAELFFAEGFARDGAAAFFTFFADVFLALPAPRSRASLSR